MPSALLPPLKPLPMKDRISMIFVRYGQIDVLDGAFVVVNKNGVRKHIPVGSVACIMLEPGTRISHAAVNLAAVVGTLLVWVGESGVRLHSSGQPGGARRISSSGDASASSQPRATDVARAGLPWPGPSGRPGQSHGPNRPAASAAGPVGTGTSRIFSCSSPPS